MVSSSCAVPSDSKRAKRLKIRSAGRTCVGSHETRAAYYPWWRRPFFQPKRLTACTSGDEGCLSCRGSQITSASRLANS
eukprot:scaffold516986_cov18-Prasinocladus_malaysianus.AAC.1